MLKPVETCFGFCSGVLPKNRKDFFNALKHFWSTENVINNIEGSIEPLLKKPFVYFKYSFNQNWEVFDFKLCDLSSDAVNKHHQITQKEFEVNVKDWLRHARQRRERENKRNEKCKYILSW